MRIKHFGKYGNSMFLLDGYNGKRVLITGHTGFKGSWLSLMLIELGAKITGYALDPVNCEDHFNLTKLNEKIEDIRGDIRDYNELYNVFEDFKPEIVFHLAAQTIVLESYRNPKDTFDINIQGTVNILECCRKSNSVKACIIVTSDKCYDNKEWLWGYREIDRLGGKDPYSASKACAEFVTYSYLKSFRELNLASVRAGNVIGGGDWANNRIIPDCMRALIANDPIIIRNPLSIRPWQHVLDALYAYLLLAIKLSEDKNTYQGVWNVGPNLDSMKTVEKLVEKVIFYWGKGKMQIEQQTNAKPEAKYLFLDTTKIRKILHWKPSWNFDDSVFYTVEWYKKYQAGENIAEISRDQIRKFLMSNGYEN